MKTTTILSSPSDDELMRGVRDSEQTPFNELYARHHVLLRKIIGQMLLSDADVEETVQDVFMEIWNRAANFDPSKGKALGWIICMARRRAVDRLRRGRRHAELRTLFQSAADGSLPIELELGEPSDEDDPAARDLRRALDSLIRLLPPEQQAVVHSVFFEGLSQRQTAARTGIPLGTIKTRLELAVKKLARWSEHLRADLVPSA